LAEDRKYEGYINKIKKYENTVELTTNLLEDKKKTKAVKIT
jgi:hypothetical protein